MTLLHFGSKYKRYPTKLDQKQQKTPIKIGVFVVLSV